MIRIHPKKNVHLSTIGTILKYVQVKSGVNPWNRSTEVAIYNKFWNSLIKFKKKTESTKFEQTLQGPFHSMFMWNLEWIHAGVSEKKLFEEIFLEPEKKIIKNHKFTASAKFWYFT